MTDNPQNPQGPQNPLNPPPQPANYDAGYQQAVRMARPKRISYTPKVKLNLPKYSPYNRPPESELPVGQWVGQSYWQDPQRIARAAAIIDAMPPGYNQPDWLDEDLSNKIKASNEYLKQSYGNEWWNWDHVLPDDDGLKAEAATWRVPAELQAAEEQTAPTGRQLMALYGIRDDDLARAGYKEDDLVNAWMQGQAQTSYQPGEVTAPYTVDEEWIKTIRATQDDIKFMYPYTSSDTGYLGLVNPDRVKQWTTRFFVMNGVTPDIAAKLPVWQMPFYALFNTIGGQVAQQAVNMGLAGGSIGAAAGSIFGPAGTLIGGVGGALLAGGGAGIVTLMQTEEERRKAEAAAAGEVYDESEFIKFTEQVYSALDVLFQAGEVGFGTMLQYAYENPLMTGGMEGWKELAENPAAVREAARLTYESAPAVVESLINSLSGKGAYYTRAELGNPETAKVEGRAGIEVATLMMRDIRKQLEAGYSPDELNSMWVERIKSGIMFENNPEYTAGQAALGFWGEFSDLAAGYWLDPLDQLGNFSNAIGGGAAKLKGKPLLAFAYQNTEGPIDAIRMYGALLRTGALPGSPKAAEIGAMGRLERMLANVDENGNPNPGATSALGRFFGMTRESLAYETLTSSVNALQLALEDANTPDDLIRVVNGIARFSPEAAAELSKSMPWIDSPDGSSFAMSLRDYKKTLSGVMAMWMAGEINRSAWKQFTHAAGYDDVTFIANVKNKGAETVFNGIVARAKQNASQNVGFLRDVQNGTLTAKYLDNMVSQHAKGGLDINFDELKGRVFVSMMDSVEKWAVKYYGIKPDAEWVRISNAIKDVQSFMLLGFNASYAINNILSNRITMAWQGVFGLRSANSIDDFWTRAIGFEPIRLDAGIGGAAGAGTDAGGTRKGYRIGTQIRAEKRKPGALTAFADFMRSDAAGKIQFATRMAQAEEVSASRQAFTAGAIKAKSKFWKAGVGFAKMPPALEAVLRSLDKRAPRLLYSMIEGVPNPKALYESLFSDVMRRSLDAAIPGAVDRLRANGLDVDDSSVRAMLDENGVYDFVSNGLLKAKDDQDIDRVWDAANEIIQARLDELAIKQRGDEAAIGSAKAAVEGVAGALEYLDSVWEDINTFWNRHFDDWEIVHSEAGALDDAGRDALYDAQFRASNREWNRMQSIRDAQIMGTLRGLGATDETMNDISIYLEETHSSWTRFYDDANSLRRDFFSRKGWKDKAERQAAWEELRQELKRRYQDALALEERNQIKIDGDFARLFAEQTQTDPAIAQTWRDGARETRKQMAKMLQDFRESLEGMDRDARSAAWKKFLDDEYRPAILKLTRANMIKAMGLYENAETTRRAPAYDRATLRELRLVLLRNDVADADQWAGVIDGLNGVLTDKEAPFTRMEYNVTPSRERMTLLEDAFRRLNDQKKAAEPEPEPPTQPAEPTTEPAETRKNIVDTGRTDAGEAGRGTETPRPEPVVPDQFSRIAEVSNRFGVPSAKVDGQPVSGFKIHIANIMAKYMPEKYSGDVVFESIDPADLETAMTRRAGNPLSEASEALQDAMIAVERARRNEYYSARAGKLGEFSDGGAVRQMAIEDLVYAYEQAGRDKKQARAEINESIALADARAAVWAKENGRMAPEWWVENIGGVMTSEQFIATFGKRLGDDITPMTKGSEAATFQVGGRSILAIFTDPNAATLAHEFAHVFRREMGIGRTAEFISYFEERYGYKLGYDEESGQFIGDEPVTDPDGNVMPLQEFAEEVFARLFEIYLREGRAPTRGLARVFDAFKTWLRSIYTSLATGELAGYDLNDNMRALYDSLFAADKEVVIDEAVVEQPAPVEAQIEQTPSRPIDESDKVANLAAVRKLVDQRLSEAGYTRNTVNDLSDPDRSKALEIYEAATEEYYRGEDIERARIDAERYNAEINDRKQYIGKFYKIPGSNKYENKGKRLKVIGLITSVKNAYESLNPSNIVFRYPEFMGYAAVLEDGSYKFYLTSDLGIDFKEIPEPKDGNKFVGQPIENASELLKILMVSPERYGYVDLDQSLEPPALIKTDQPQAEPEPSTAIYETALPSEVEQAQHPDQEAKAEPEPGVIYERAYTPEQAADYARMLVRLSDKEIETALSEEPAVNRPGLRAAIEAEKAAGALENRLDAKLSEVGLTREQVDALPIGEERNKAADVIDAAASEYIKAAEDARLIEKNKAKIERGLASVEEAKRHIGEFYMLNGGDRGKLIGVITRVGEVDAPGGKTERYLYHDGFVFVLSDGTPRIYEDFPVSALTPRYDPIPRKLETPKNAKKFPDRVDPTVFRDHFIDYRGRDRSSDYGYIDAYETMTPKALAESATTTEPATVEPAAIAARLDAGEEVSLEDAIKVTPEIEEAGQPTRKYSVDTEQIGGGLFFKAENGDLYRAAPDSPADDKGLPNGARWEAPAHQAEQRLSVLRATAEETSRAEPAQAINPIITGNRVREYASGALGDAQRELDNMLIPAGQGGLWKPGITRDMVQSAVRRIDAIKAAQNTKYRDGKSVAETIDGLLDKGFVALDYEASKILPKYTKGSYILLNPDTQEYLVFKSREEKHYIDTVLNRGDYKINRDKIESALNSAKQVEPAPTPEPTQAAAAPEPATAPVEPAPAQPAGARFDTYTAVMEYQKFIRRGEYSAEEIRQAFDAFMSARAQIEAQISRMTIDQIKKTFRMYRPGNKAEAVASAMGTLEDGFIAAGGYTWNTFGEKRVDAVRRAVSEQTDEMIKDAARRNTEAKDALVKALTNPEKLDEFQTFIARRGVDALSTEQKIKYDELVATRNMQQRAPKPAEAAAVAPVATEAKATIKETTKKRDGTPIFVVQLSDRVPREVFTDMSSKARKLGGYYSNFVKADAGFTFTTRDAAERFMALLESEDARQVRAEEAATATMAAETTEAPAATEEPTGTGEALAAALRPVKAVNKLRALADRLEESGNERLNADRNTNTQKRAREAAYAEENARADIAMARTVRNIADALDSGEARFLGGISAKTQIETLDMLLRNAQGARQRKEKIPYSESLRYAPATMADIEYAEYPYPRFSTYALKEIKEKLGNKAGFKQAIKRLEALVNRSSNGTTDWFKVTDARDIETLIEVVKEVKGSYVLSSVMLDDYKRVQAAGLLTIEELRAGLREYLAYKTQREKPSRVKELERSLIGRKIPGYFPTPRGLAQRVVSTADIQPGMKVLEPSAGKGSIAEVVNEMHRDANLSVIEYDATLKNILVEKGFNVVGYDIFGHTGQYDRIVMNPPFENMADIDHVMKAYNDLLKPGGRLVSIMGAGPFFRNDAKAVEFRNFLDRIGADYEQLPEGSFLESDRSTGVNTYIVTLDKAPELPSKEELVSIEDTVRAAVEAAMTETPAAVEEAPAYAAPVETAQRAPGEKVNAWGFTKQQELYIAGEIEALYNALYTEEYKKHYPGLDEKDAVTRTVNELRDAKDQPNLVLNVPDGPNMRLTTVNAMNNVYYAMTGRTLAGFKKATEARNPSTAKMPPVPDMDVWGVLRMYGNPINALETIKRQGGYQSDASRALISDLQGMVDGTWSLYRESANGLGFNSKTKVISSEGISQSDYQRQIMEYANNQPLTLIDRLVPVGGFRIEEVNNLAGEIGVTIDQTAAEAAPTGPFETVIGSRDIPTLDLSSESSIKKHLAPLLVDAARILKEERAKRADEEFKAVHGRAGELFKGGTGQIFGRSAKMSVDSDRNEMVIYSSTKTDGFRFTVRLTDEGWEVFGRRFGSYDATDIGNLLGLHHKETSVKIMLGGINYTFINERQAAAIYKAITGKKMPGYEETVYPTATMSSVLYKRGPNTNTPEFRRWFGESKVVDENGRPLVVYHGTLNSFSEFDPSKIGSATDPGEYGEGFYFGLDPDDIESSYLHDPEHWNKPAKGANIMPVYLRLNNPINIRNRAELLEKMGVNLDGKFTIDGLRETAKTIPEWLQSNGYDGIIVQTRTDEGKYLQIREMVALRPEQIKSTFNQGTFDPNNPNILFKRGTTASVKKLRKGQKHGEYNVIAGVYYQGDDGIKKLAAWLPERWDIGAWRKDDQGEYRVLGLDLDDPNKMVVEDRKGGIRSVEIKPKQEATPAINAPIGAVDANRSAPPMYNGMQEHYERDIRPVMDALRRSSKERDTNIKPEMLKRLNDGSAEMNEAKAMLKAYAAQVKAQSGGARLAIAKMGELQRDMALLNYSKRYGFDNLLTAIFPYQFWYTRSVANWAARFIQKPSILANYARLRAMQERHTRDGFPSRLDGKIGIPLPFMPEGAGGGIFVDPMRIMYPFENFATPLARLAQQDNRNTKAAKGIIYQWIEDGTETESAALEAINTKKGAIWERAMRAVKSGEDQDIANPFDFMNAMSGFSLPLNYAYQYTLGNPKRIGQTPIMRMVQSGLGLAGANPKIADYLNKPRVAMGLPAVDQWQDYRIDRELANMTADGLISSDQARTAMVDRAGETFDAARRRLGKQQGIKYLFASFLADLYPEGEQTQRALQNDYYKAIDALDNGDSDALKKFYDAHPEYEARVAQMQEPEERLRGMLVAEVWDRYTQQNPAEKRAYADQFGDVFEQAFLNKETRDYTAISAETLAWWAKSMGGNLPMKAPDTPDVVTPDMPESVQQYYDDLNSQFPNAGRIWNMYYSMDKNGQDMMRKAYPQLDAYTAWKNKYFAQHPEVIQYVTNDNAELAGLPLDIQSRVYSFRATRDERYPGIFEIQDGYFAIPEEQRKAYKKEHPELEEYWDWRRSYAAAYPKASPWILSEESLSNAIIGQYGSAERLTNEQLAEFSPALMRALLAVKYAGDELRSGMESELYQHWQDFGEPGGDFDAWVQDSVYPSLE